MTITDNNLTQEACFICLVMYKWPKLTLYLVERKCDEPNSITINFISTQKRIASVGILYCYVDNLTQNYSMPYHGHLRDIVCQDCKKCP